MATAAFCLSIVGLVMVSVNSGLTLYLLIKSHHHE